MPAYTVTAPLLHDGKDYLPGDTVELNDDYVQGLVALGVVAPAEAKAARKKKADEE